MTAGSSVPGRTVSLEERIKLRARELGFDPVGIARLGPAERFDTFADWLAGRVAPGQGWPGGGPGSPGRRNPCGGSWHNHQAVTLRGTRPTAGKDIGDDSPRQPGAFWW